MAKAYICDLLGSTHQGDGAKEVVVDIGKVVLKVEAYVKIGKEKLVGPGELSPDACEKIKTALAVLADKK